MTKAEEWIKQQKARDVLRDPVKLKKRSKGITHVQVTRKPVRLLAFEFNVHNLRTEEFIVFGGFEMEHISHDVYEYTIVTPSGEAVVITAMLLCRNLDNPAVMHTTTGRSWTSGGYFETRK